MVGHTISIYSPVWLWEAYGRVFTIAQSVATHIKGTTDIQKNMSRNPITNTLAKYLKLDKGHYYQNNSRNKNPLCPNAYLGYESSF